MTELPKSMTTEEPFDPRKMMYESTTYIWKDTFDTQVKPDFSVLHVGCLKKYAEAEGREIIRYKEWQHEKGWSVLLEIDMKGLTKEERDKYLDFNVLEYYLKQNENNTRT